MMTSFQVPEEMEKRVKPLLTGTQTVSQFAFAAFEEKINRMEKRDEQARHKVFMRDVEILRPIVKEVIKEVDRDRIAGRII
jgi:hypothetical protein